MTKKSTTTEAPPRWKNRVVGWDTVDPTQLLANPRNWRRHPGEAARGPARLAQRAEHHHPCDRQPDHRPPAGRPRPGGGVHLRRHHRGARGLRGARAREGGPGPARPGPDRRHGRGRQGGPRGSDRGRGHRRGGPAGNARRAGRPGARAGARQPGRRHAARRRHGLRGAVRRDRHVRGPRPSSRSVYERLAGEGFSCRVVAV